jgi:hypothetical protein
MAGERNATNPRREFVAVAGEIKVRGVIPAQAGIQRLRKRSKVLSTAFAFWISACAEMTTP